MATVHQLFEGTLIRCPKRHQSWSAVKNCQICQQNHDKMTDFWQLITKDDALLGQTFDKFVEMAEWHDRLFGVYGLALIPVEAATKILSSAGVAEKTAILTLINMGLIFRVKNLAFIHPLWLVDQLSRWEKFSKNYNSALQRPRGPKDTPSRRRSRPVNILVNFGMMKDFK